MIKSNMDDLTLQKYGFPQDIIIETTSRCNLSCIMCPQKLLTRKRGDMRYNTYFKIIDEAKEYKPRIWLAIMGEPLLLEEKLYRMVRDAFVFGLDVYINTNATLSVENLINPMRQAKQFIIGLDAISPKTYNKIRINGNYKRAVNNTITLLNLGANVVVQFIEMEENKHETELFKDFWLSMGATVKIRPKLGWGSGVKADNLILPESERIPCSWLARTISIHSDGSIAQCDADWDDKYNIGNINDMTIKEAWDGELKKRRDRHWNNDFDFEPCKSCKDWQAGRSYFYYPEK